MDWKARARNKVFWVTMISAVLTILTALGVAINTGKVETIAGAALGILTLMGVIVDPSTPGVKDQPVEPLPPKHAGVPADMTGATTNGATAIEPPAHG